MTAMQLSGSMAVLLAWWALEARTSMKSSRREKKIVVRSVVSFFVPFIRECYSEVAPLFPTANVVCQLASLLACSFVCLLISVH